MMNRREARDIFLVTLPQLWRLRTTAVSKNVVLLCGVLEEKTVVMVFICKKKTKKKNAERKEERWIVSRLSLECYQEPWKYAPVVVDHRNS
jgi:hypothetical protein